MQTDAIIAAFTEEQTERLTNVSRRQLRSWAHNGFFTPGVAFENPDLPGLRLYSFRDLVCLKVISALRNEIGVPLSHLHEVKDRLSHLGDDLWAKTTLYVLGKRVVFDNSETGEKEEAISGQGVLEIPLQIASGDMARAVEGMRRRGADIIGRIEKRRGASRPVIAGTRIPIQSIQAFADSGFSISEIRDQYPDITEKDIEAAIHYKASA